MQPTDAAPTQQAIDAAAMRLAHVTRFPTFVGAVYAFADATLESGAWFADPDHPLVDLSYLAVEVQPPRGDSLALTAARCRILIEDALAARQSSTGASSE